MSFIRSLNSERIKTRRSAASWLCLVGGFFIPTIYMIYMLTEHHLIGQYFGDMWAKHFDQLWRDMAVFLMPLGMIMSSSLITQLEFKNNSWKQLNTTPQSYTNIFIAKFAVIVIMTLKSFLYFNIGIFVSAIVPNLVYEGKLPEGEIPIRHFLEGNLMYFLTCLPIMAVQYLMSLHFKNFLVSFGIGFALLIGSMIGIMKWYIFLSPYAYSTRSVMNPYPNWYPLVYFAVIMMISYVLFVRKREKG